MSTRLDSFFQINLGFLVPCVLLAIIICWMVRTDWLAGFHTPASRNIVLGVLLVVTSLVPIGVASTTFLEFKKQEEFQAQIHQETTEKALAKSVKPGSGQNPPVVSGTSIYDALKENRQETYTIMEKFIDLVGLLLGFLGGALGVNILTDGLLRRDKLAVAIVPMPPRDLHVRRTVFFKGWKLHYETVREHRLPVTP